ncbi:hypothetical protein Vafri_6051 [Volvox africanus]|nr:hypothetical protein Vafri_6051 [Volvox africanus]
MPWSRSPEWIRMLRSHRATRNVLSFTILVAIIYCALYLAVGPDLLPGGNAWSTLLIFLAAHVGGALCGMLGLPPLLGMLLAGLLLRNATPSLVSGLPPSWSATFRALALGTIFLRSGLELDLQMFRRVGPAAVRLLLLPGLVEAFTTAGAAVGIMKMPPFWALTQGFILKAVGPAVVIQTMFDLQKRGLGVNKGIPAIVVGAASFDDMVAISGYSLFSSFAMSSITSSSAGGGGGGGGAGPSHGLTWTLLHGPLDIALGAIAGLIGASLCAATRLWDSALKRTAVVFAAAMALLFALYRYDFRGGGALAALVLGLAVNVFWERGSLFFWGIGRRSGLTRGPQPRYSMEVEARVGLFWRVVAQPLLFGIIGSLVNLRTVSAQVIPKSLALVAIGMAVRIPTTYFAMTGAGMSPRERVFVSIAWTPKATVQAALGAQPLDMIRNAAGPHSPLLEVGHEILTTSVFAIIICANIGVSLIHYLAPRWLHRTLPPTVVMAATVEQPPPPSPAPPPSSPPCGTTTMDGRRAAAGEPSSTEAAPREIIAGAVGVYSTSGDSDGRGGGHGSSVRPLRVGPMGYNWAEESYSPTPRSIRRSCQGGQALAAVMAVSGGGGGGGSGNLWCRCLENGGTATDNDKYLTARAKLPFSGLPPRPAAARPGLASHSAAAGVRNYNSSSGGSSSSSSERDDRVAGVGGTGTASASATEGYDSPERNAAKIQHSMPYHAQGITESEVEVEGGLLRCRRCGGRLLPPRPPSHNIWDSPDSIVGRASSPPTMRRPQQRRHRASMQVPYGDVKSDIESGSGAAVVAEQKPSLASRLHSAPVLTDEQLVNHLLNAAVTAVTLPPSLPQPDAAGRASRSPTPGGAPLLQCQLLELESAAGAIAALAARLAAANPAEAVHGAAGSSDVAVPSFADDIEELAARAVALHRTAGAVRHHLSAVVTAAAKETTFATGQGEWLSGEEADDEDGGGGGCDAAAGGSDGGGGGGGASEEEPLPPETAREFFRRVKAAVITAATTCDAAASPSARRPNSAAHSILSAAPPLPPPLPPPPPPSSTTVVIPVSSSSGRYGEGDVSGGDGEGGGSKCVTAVGGGVF